MRTTFGVIMVMTASMAFADVEPMRLHERPGDNDVRAAEPPDPFGDPNWSDSFGDRGQGITTTPTDVVGIGTGGVLPPGPKLPAPGSVVLFGAGAAMAARRRR